MLDHPNVISWIPTSVSIYWSCLINHGWIAFLIWNVARGASSKRETLMIVPTAVHTLHSSGQCSSVALISHAVRVVPSFHGEIIPLTSDRDGWNISALGHLTHRMRDGRVGQDFIYSSNDSAALPCYQMAVSICAGISGPSNAWWQSGFKTPIIPTMAQPPYPVIKWPSHAIISGWGHPSDLWWRLQTYICAVISGTSNARWQNRRETFIMPPHDHLS
jgi:hypothetical protein